MANITFTNVSGIWIPRLPSEIYHLDYPLVSAGRDLFGICLLPMLLTLLLTDPVLRGRNMREIFFVCFLFFDRLQTMARQIPLSFLVKEEQSIPIHQRFCFVLSSSYYFFHHNIFAFAVYLSWAHYKHMQNRTIFVMWKWFMGTSLCTLSMIGLHYLFGVQYRWQGCCCTPVSMDLNDIGSFADFAIHFCLMVMNLRTLCLSHAHQTVMPLSLLFFSLISMPSLIAWIGKYRSNARNHWLSILHDSRGEMFCAVLFLTLLFKEPRFRLVLEAKLKNFRQRGEVLDEEQSMSEFETSDDE